VSELRRDPITGRQVIIVPGRSARPNEHAVTPPAIPTDSGCPFCEGNEAKTPAEVAVDAPPGRAPNTRGWYVRTIPNRFPTVECEPVGETSVRPSSQRSLFEPVVASGSHEVVIESPTHSPFLPFLAPEQVVRVLRMCRDRVHHLSREPGVGSVTLFENSGPESGGSLWHPHAQLVTLPELTPALSAELAGAERFCAARGGECAFEEVARAEVGEGSRVILKADGLLAIAPFASLVPYEVRVMSTEHAPSFGDASDQEVEVLSSHLAPLLRVLLGLLPGASYNLVLRTPGASTTGVERYHWHLDVVPRLVRPDGFDLGSEVAVNTVPPEVAAEALRAAVGAKRY